MAAQATEPAERWLAYDELSLTPILSASLAALQQHGFHGTTVRDIASRVGVTMPTLYYHHGSKEGILMALLDIAMDDLLAHMDGGLAAAGADTTAQFENLVTSHVMHSSCRVELARLHPEFRFLGSEARKAYVAKRSTVETALVAIIDAGVKEGIFHVDDIPATARMILGMVNGIPDWYREGGGATPVEIARAYVDSALRIVGASAT